MRTQDMISGNAPMMSAFLRPNLDWAIFYLNIYGYCQYYLSIKIAAPNGEEIEPIFITTTIQEFSSGVIGIGEFSPSSIGSVGDVQPNAAAAERSRSVAKLEMFNFFYFFIN